MRRATLVLTLTALTCTPSQRQVTCASQSDCTGGLVCNAVTGLCQEPGKPSARPNAINGWFDCPFPPAAGAPPAGGAAGAAGMAAGRPPEGRFEAIINPSGQPSGMAGSGGGAGGAGGAAAFDPATSRQGICLIREHPIDGQESLFVILFVVRRSGQTEGSAVLVARSSAVRAVSGGGVLQSPSAIAGALYEVRDALLPDENPNQLRWYLWGGSLTVETTSMDAAGNRRVRGRFDLDLVDPPPPGMGTYGGACELMRSCAASPDVDQRCFREESFSPDCGEADCLPNNDGTNLGFCNAACESSRDCTRFDRQSECLTRTGIPVGICQHECLTDAECGTGFKCEVPAEGAPGPVGRRFCTYQARRELPPPDEGMAGVGGLGGLGGMGMGGFGGRGGAGGFGGMGGRGGMGGAGGAGGTGGAGGMGGGGTGGAGGMSAACDPLSTVGCPPGQACYATTATAPPSCQPAGSTPTGGMCTQSSNCLPMHACINSTCRQLCTSTGMPGCPMGQTCMTVGGGTTGFCR